MSSQVGLSDFCCLFLNRSVFDHAMIPQLDIKTICCLSGLNKAWKQWIDNRPEFWERVFKESGIPAVMQAGGQQRYSRADFVILYPMTQSGSLIGGIFGKVVGEIPPIPERLFNALRDRPDPFDSTQSMRKTFELVVMPKFIEVTAGPGSPLYLDIQGNLLDANNPNPQAFAVERKLMVPLNLRNLRVLSSHPLKRSENGPVFEYFKPEILTQCNTSWANTSVFVMRKQIVEATRSKSYTDQEAMVRAQRFTVTPLLVRVFSDALKILASGRCPDGRTPWTYARAPETVQLLWGVYHTAVGGFAPRCGASVDCNGDARDFIGVAPGGPAEVLDIGT